MSEIIEVRGLQNEPRETMGPAIGRRFTPAFQTDNGDASIGDTGIASASYWIVGAILRCQGFFVFGGAGISIGTGNLQLPLPPGFSLSSLAVDSMPLALHSDGPPAVDEVLIPVAAQGLLGGVRVDFFSSFAFEKFTNPDSLLASWFLDGIAAVANADQLLFSYAVPIL
jgi:hypothetical protein